MAVLCGCGSPSPAITVEGAPIVLAEEGTRIELAIDVADAPAAGDCAPPLDPAALAVVAADADAAQFATLAVAGEPGRPVLAIEASCGALQVGSADRLVDVQVASTTACATPAPLRIQLGNAGGASCFPLISAWLGDCAVPPADAGTSVIVPAVAAPGPLCVRVASRDPAGEQLWVRGSTSAPRTMIGTVDLPAADAISGEVIMTVPLGATTDIRGLFHLDLAIARSADLIAEIAGSIDLLVGDPGLAIEVLATSVAATELDVARLLTRVWRLPAVSPGESLCARARRVPPAVTPLPRDKPFLRLVSTTGEQSGGEDEWVCAEQFELRVSPPLDAPVSEQVEIEAGLCVDCGTTPMPSGETLTRTIDAPVASVADQVSCGSAAAISALEVACADLSGDGTPELVYRNAGAIDRTCAWSGDAGRLTPVALAVGSTEIPDRLSSLMWRDPVNGPVPLVLGRFGTQPRLRTLAIAGGEATWSAASALGLAPATTFALERSRPMAADPAQGATHMASPGTNPRDVIIRCIAPALAGCQDLALPTMAPVDTTVRDVGVADLDGDGDQDVIVFAVSDLDEEDAFAVAKILSWPTPGAPQVVATTFPPTALGHSGDRFPSAPIERPNCGPPPCEQEVLVLPLLDGVERTAMLRLAHAGGLDSFNTVALHGARDLTGRDGRVFLGMGYEVAEAHLAETGGALSWTSRDPVVLEDLLVGPLVSKTTGYGAALSVCTGSVPSLAFTVDTFRSRLTRLGIDVVLP